MRRVDLFLRSHSAGLAEHREPHCSVRANGSNSQKEPNVHIRSDVPGVDHDAVMHSSDVGTLVATTATARSGALSVAQALERIGACLEDANAPPC